MAAEDLLRLAWEADHDGRRSLRDALLTLAISEGGPGEDWPERCRARLVSERPGHYLASYPTVRRALEDPRVLEARDRLRRKYPAERVEWLLFRARVARGTFTGRAESLGAMIEDLAGPLAELENVRLDAPEAVRGPLAKVGASRAARLHLSYPPMTGRGGRLEAEGLDLLAPPVQDRPDDGSFNRRFHYFSVLFALAMVLAALPEVGGQREARSLGG